MLSVIIETLNSERALAHTLSALVPAVVEGLLRRVTVVDRGSSDETALVALGAGCDFYAEMDIEAALDEIRTPWVLLLKPGAVPQEGWEEVLRRHMESDGDVARFSLPEDSGFGTVRKIFGHKATLDAGLLVRLDVIKPLLLDGVAFDQLPQRLKTVRLKHPILPPDED
ncbi:glycosyl transferase [Ochrobactrum oryzae]|uniref:Glycosyl transferase n=1 Tax=Brucella oryzae TaxID=335286 RepID=A0A2S7IXM5_9HYPH|nr:glycosyl transferase [Brucella oryzae]MBR7651089.1 glycosyl transferase [Brucella oryzae]NKC22448.1 glycosyl transferase [Brucella oryzae]PQA72706.1 glycosyl transferase [Brucella oryzae]